MTCDQKTLPKLRFVKFTTARGKPYAYFNLGKPDGKQAWTPLPRVGSPEFYEVYARYLEARAKPSMLSFNDEQIEAEKLKARDAAEKSLDRFKNTLVYFIQSDGGEIKIGITNDISKRMGTLSVAHAKPLTLLATTTGGAVQEKAYHRMFKIHRLRGEWFSPAPEITAEIRRLNKWPTFKPFDKQAPKGAN